MEKSYKWVCEDDLGRRLPKELLVAWDGGLWTSTASSFEMNNFHVDCKGADYIQCEIIFWSQHDFHARGTTLRGSLLTSFLEPSDQRCYKNLLSIACRHSQMQTGGRHRSGPLARPVPSRMMAGKIAWKVACRGEPPKGFATFKEYGRHRRRHSHLTRAQTQYRLHSQFTGHIFLAIEHLLRCSLMIPQARGATPARSANALNVTHRYLSRCGVCCGQRHRAYRRYRQVGLELTMLTLY